MRSALLLAVLLAASSITCLAQQAPRRISVIAHRGAAGEAPENSLAAIEAAIRIGCDIIEVDVRLSQDGKVVLIHDGTVDRTTNGRGRVDELSWSRLRELDARGSFSETFEGTRIPSLNEAIDLVRGRARLYLDVKVTNLAPVVLTVQQAGFSHSVLYRLYRPQDIDRLRSLDRSSQVVVGIDEIGLLPGAVEVVLSRHPDAVLSVDFRNWSERLEGTVVRHSSRWFVTVLGRQTTVSELREAVNLHPDGIMTDSPRLLLKLLREDRISGIAGNSE